MKRAHADELAQFIATQMVIDTFKARPGYGSPDLRLISRGDLHDLVKTAAEATFERFIKPDCADCKDTGLVPYHCTRDGDPVTVTCRCRE